MYINETKCKSNRLTVIIETPRIRYSADLAISIALGQLDPYFLRALRFHYLAFWALGTVFGPRRLTCRLPGQKV